MILFSPGFDHDRVELAVYLMKGNLAILTNFVHRPKKRNFIIKNIRLPQVSTIFIWKNWRYTGGYFNSTEKVYLIVKKIDNPEIVWLFPLDLRELTCGAATRPAATQPGSNNRIISPSKTGGIRIT